MSNETLAVESHSVQKKMDQALIINENFLRHDKKMPLISDYELMNTDNKYFHYRISVYGIDSKMINHLKNNGYSIKSINCIQGYKIGKPSNFKVWYSFISLSLKWKINF